MIQALGSALARQFLVFPQEGRQLQLLQIVNRLSILTPNRRAKLTPLSGTAEVVPVVNRGDPRGFV